MKVLVTATILVEAAPEYFAAASDEELIELVRGDAAAFVQEADWCVQR